MYFCVSHEVANSCFFKHFHKLVDSLLPKLGFPAEIYNAKDGSKFQNN